MGEEGLLLGAMTKMGVLPLVEQVLFPLGLKTLPLTSLNHAIRSRLTFAGSLLCTQPFLWLHTSMIPPTPINEHFHRDPVIHDDRDRTTEGLVGIGRYSPSESSLA